MLVARSPIPWMKLYVTITIPVVSIRCLGEGARILHGMGGDGTRYVSDERWGGVGVDGVDYEINATRLMISPTL